MRCGVRKEEKRGCKVAGSGFAPLWGRVARCDIVGARFGVTLFAVMYVVFVGFAVSRGGLCAGAGPAGLASLTRKSLVQAYWHDILGLTPVEFITPCPAHIALGLGCHGMLRNVAWTAPHNQPRETVLVFILGWWWGWLVHLDTSVARVVGDVDQAWNITAR